MEYLEINKQLFLSKYKVKTDMVNKSSAGKLLIMAGSRGLYGASALCTLSALRSGSGYVTLATTNEVANMVFPLAPESTYKIYPVNSNGKLKSECADEILSLSSAYNAMVLGCGLGLDNDVIELVNKIVQCCQKPLIIDADGINSICNNIDVLKNSSCEVIITPHPGEMSRLTGYSTDYVVENRYQIAKDFSCEYGVTVVLKGYETVIATNNKMFLLSSPNSGLAKAGSGDVLAGIIGSLCAQGFSAIDSAVCGVYLHSHSGKIASEKLSKQFMQPRDIVNGLAYVFGDINNDEL